MPAVIHIVDDDASFRKSLAALLRASGYDVVLHDSADHLLMLPPEPGPGCILLDVKMPGLSGLELQDRLNRLGSLLPIIFLSGHVNIPATVRTIKAGAEDFLAKPVTKLDLLQAIELALKHHDVAVASHQQIAALQLRFAKLTPRERSVFAMVAQGQLNKEIAFALGTAERTIKAHRQKVMQKLEARSLLDLAAMAEKLGVLNAPENRPAAPSGADAAR